MTKLWFKTKNDQIVDLYSMLNIWLEDLPNHTYTVFCKDNSKQEIDWRIGEFNTKEEAQEYLHEIYQLLTGHILYRCDECKKYPPLKKTNNWPYFQCGDSECTINCTTCKNETVACSCMDDVGE